MLMYVNKLIENKSNLNFNTQSMFKGSNEKIKGYLKFNSMLQEYLNCFSYEKLHALATIANLEVMPPANDTRRPLK